ADDVVTALTLTLVATKIQISTYESDGRDIWTHFNQLCRRVTNQNVTNCQDSCYPLTGPPLAQCQGHCFDQYSTLVCQNDVWGYGFYTSFIQLGNSYHGIDFNMPVDCQVNDVRFAPYTQQIQSWVGPQGISVDFPGVSRTPALHCHYVIDADVDITNM